MVQKTLRTSAYIPCPMCNGLGAIFGGKGEGRIQPSDWYLIDHKVHIICSCGYEWDEELTKHFSELPILNKTEAKVFGKPGYYKSFEEATKGRKFWWGKKLIEIPDRYPLVIGPLYDQNGRKRQGCVNVKTGRPIDWEMYTFVMTRGHTQEEVDKAYLVACEEWEKYGEKYPLFLHEQKALGDIKDMDELIYLAREFRRIEKEHEEDRLAEEAKKREENED